MGRWTKTSLSIAGTALITIATLFTISFTLKIDSKTEKSEAPEQRFGWAGPEGVKKAAPLVATMRTFKIVGAPAGDDNTTKNVRLWDSSVKVLGSHIPNYAQEIGDCVSFGAKNACNYLLCVEIANGSPGLEFHEAYPPWIYGGSRVNIGHGQLGRGDGSVGAWAAQFVQQFGVLRKDLDGVPAYSGSIAKTWGQKGPPKEFFPQAIDFKVSTVSPIRSADEARDALCNGYPVTIASDWGSTKMPQVDGRIVATRNANWPHQMCLIAYDGKTGSEPYFYILNSWGPDAHPKPLQGEPPGGFWVRKKDVDYITRQGDSFAYSNFKGFPARDLDFTVIGKKQAARSLNRKSEVRNESRFNLAP